MARLAIRTDNFRLSFKLIESLRSKQLEFTVLELNKPVPNESIIWFSSPSEIVNFPSLGTPIPVEIDTIDTAILSAMFQLKGPSASISLVIGIDPGPYPGIAWLVDGAFCGIMQLTSIEDVVPKLLKLRKIAEFEEITIRVGDGAPLIRDRIVNECVSRNWITEQVNESRTSSGLIRNNHSISALRIAANSGTKVWQTREINPTQGDIKYIQTESRKHSKGGFTISKKAAMMVAKGELTMEEATALRSRYSSEE